MRSCWLVFFFLTCAALADAQQTSIVPPPGPLTNTYRGHGIAFRYPSNWSVVEQEGRIMITPPGSRRVAPDRQEHFSHGVLVGFAQPTGNETVNDATQQLFTFYQKANPTFREVGQRRSGEATGSSFVNAGWMDTDPYLGDEGGLLLVVRERHGFWWWLMVAPRADLEAYMSTFVGIAGHIDFEQEPATQAGEHTEHRAIVDRVVERLRHNRLTLPNFQVIITSQPELNAWANPNNDTILVPALMVDFLRQDEGELAFLIAHELGHLQDKQCAAIAPQVRITQLGQERFCEARADEIGLQYLMGAGYNPYDAAAFFGRMMMFQGDTGLLSNIVLRFLSTHPVNMDRIEDLRRTLASLCQSVPNSCSSGP